jgi:hypothetical protein
VAAATAGRRKRTSKLWKSLKISWDFYFGLDSLNLGGEFEEKSSRATKVVSRTSFDFDFRSSSRKSNNNKVCFDFDFDFEDRFDLDFGESKQQHLKKSL